MKRKRTPVRCVHWAVVFLLMALVLPASLSAQESRGRITGRVVDASKATVPGATVTVTDVSRGTTVAVTTNEQGLFQVPFLLPGVYRVEVELAGFKKYIRENLVLQTGETQDLAVVLDVGAVQETVSVVGETPLLRTADASLGLVIDQERLASLPLVHGDPYTMMALAPGLTATGDPRLDRPFEPTHIIGYAYDGTRGNRSDLLIDGLPSTATANANEVIATYTPPSDLVQEMKVQTATFDAQFGNTEGGVTSMIIKSGTNSFHGSAYYFAEPSSWGANDYFGKLRGQAKIESNSNRPGGTIGGPIFKDKTFFMFGYERITDTRPRFDAANTSWVPTEALRNGDFSAYSGNVTIYDPLTRTGTTTFTGLPFSDNKIPLDRIDPVSRAVLDYYCLPKNPGTNPALSPSGNIFDSTLPEQTKAYDSVTARIDQRISANNRMFGRFSWYERNSHYNDYLGTVASGTLFQFISWQAVVDDVHVFNPTTILNVRYGYNRFDRNSDFEKPEALGFDLTKLGFPAEYNSLIPESIRRFPRLDFTGGVISVAYGGDLRPVTSHTVAATLTKSMGAHAVKSGVEIRQYGERSTPLGNNQSGQYAFTNSYTKVSSASGSDYEGLQAYASFLLGLPSTTSITRSPSYDEYSRTYGFFVQDDWRITNKLTLNLGLRYEVESALVEKNNGSVSGFDYEYVQPIQPTVQANYAALNDPSLKALVPQLYLNGGLQYVGLDTPTTYTTPKDTLLPRVGFAYQLDPKTIVRGGVGLFAGFLGERRGDVIQTGYSQTTTIATTKNANGAPIPYYWDNALLTTPIQEPVGNAQGRQSNVGNTITFFNQNPKVSKQFRGQIGVQRELAAGFVVEAAYVYNYGYNIEITRDINALAVQYLNADNSRTAAMTANNTFLTGSVANPFYPLLPGTSLSSSTVSRTQLMRKYPQFSGAVNTTNNDGKSWYSGGQFGVQKRFSQGYTVGMSYTYSKWMQQTEYLNAGDANPTKMISDLDAPHRLSISGVISLPFGKGRHYMSDASAITEAFVGGWQIQGVYTYQTGFPVVFGTDLFYNGTDPVNGSDIALPASKQTVNGTSVKWFNTDVFTSILTDPVSANSQPVSHLRTLPTRFSKVRSDSVNNVDLSLLKNLTLPRAMRLQVRFEFTNVLNHAYLCASARSAPVVNPTSTSFGQVTNSNQANYPRRAQIGVKLIF
jgi:hypothetical protein